MTWCSNSIASAGAVRLLRVGVPALPNLLGLRAADVDGDQRSGIIVSTGLGQRVADLVNRLGPGTIEGGRQHGQPGGLKRPLMVGDTLAQQRRTGGQ